MSSTVATLRRPARLAVGVAVLALALAGCSASGSGTTTQSAPSTGTGQNGAGGQRQPGVSGLIAARSGSTLQVQSSTEQTAVTFTGKTTFTELGSAAAAALKTGLCAAVRPAQGTDASAGTTVAAGSVTLSTPVDGECTGGFGGMRPSGAPSGGPSGAPSDVPGGAPSGAAPSGAPSGGPGQGGFRGADGKVTSVDGSTFVVAAAQPGGGTTTNVTVTTSSSTTWSQLAKATADAAKVGKCAFAVGSTGSTGSLTATTIRISAPTSDGTCGGGFGGRGSGQGGGQPGSGSTTNG